MRSSDSAGSEECKSDSPVRQRAGGAKIEKYPVIDWGRHGVLGGPALVDDRLYVTPSSSGGRQQFFTESLILAQDERWRRA